MDPEEIEYYRNLKREEKFVVPNLLKNLEERSLGHSKRNVTSKEVRELFAEEALIEKDNYDELCCEMPGMPRSTFLMVFSPDGTKVASTHGNHNIYITDIRNGKNLKTLVGHPRTPWCIAFHPSSNQILASGCLGGQVRIWDLSGGSEVWTATNQTVIASIAFHPLERFLVIATSNELYFWDWGKPEPFLHTSTGSHKEKVRYVAFDKLGHKMITGISNSHSRWEYVRSSERSHEPPSRHFNISSRRPVLRRGLFPGRHNLSASSSSAVPRETPSRVPERERNITISYRNLVRQYGRLVQRYLQLYRPPAMIDRGTDPMENYVPSSSNDTSELQESNSSNNASNVQEPDASNNSADLQESITSNNTRNLQEPNISNASGHTQESNISNNNADSHESNITNTNASLQEPDGSHNTVNSQEPNIATNSGELPEPTISNNPTNSQESVSKTADVKKTNTSSNSKQLHESDNSNSLLDYYVASYMKHRNETERVCSTSRVQPSGSSSAAPSLSKKHKQVTAPQNHIPRKKSKKSGTDHGEHHTSGSESPQPDNSTLLNQPSGDLAGHGMTVNVLPSTSSAQGADKIECNDTETNQESPTQNVVLETENHDSNILSGEHVENTSEDSALDNQESNISSGVQTDNSNENSENTQEPTTSQNQQESHPWYATSCISSFLYQIGEITDTPADDTQEQNAREPATESPPTYPTSNHGTDPNPHEPSSLSTHGPSSLVDGYVPGSSGVSENRESGEEQVLESMMMNMRRNAEDNLRARFMPVIRSRVPENDREELISLPESPESSPPNPVGNTSTGTTNSTSYSLARRRLDSGQNQRPQVFGIRPLSSPTVINNFPRDEVINFSEFPNSEDDPFLAPERTEPSPSSSSETFHPFNPPPNLPAINPENIGIGNMYSNIVQDLETSLSTARDARIHDRPGEMSSMLSNFANRLETLMNQSEGILRNLRTSVDVLPDSDPIEYAEEAPVPTASFNDSTFFVRDQRTEGTSSGENFNDPLEYDSHQNTATSDHTYPRNSDTGGSSPNINETMSPLMSSLHLTLSHIQSQSRLLHRQVECIERIDRAMVEVAQLQLMRLLLVELSTYVRNLSGESRSTSMTSVRQMMAGTRISDSSPSEVENTREEEEETPIYDPGPSTSSGPRGTNQTSSTRSRGSTRKTYPPSRLNRPRDAEYARSTRNSQNSSRNPLHLPPVAPRHTYSHINLFTLIRMDRRLQTLIDDHSTRFSYFNEHYPGGSRRQYNEIGEHNLALRLRESITRTNRLLGNIFNANVVGNYRIDSSTSLRYGMERYYERTLLSLIIDGLSSYLDNNRTSRLPSDMRARMQNVLQLAMIMSDLLLLYTINSLAPATVPDLTLNTERNILANRISEACTTLIQCRQYRNFSNIFVTSLRSLRLMVSTYCSHNYTRYIQRRREFIRTQLATPHLAGSLDELNEVVDRGQIAPEESDDNTDAIRASNDNTSRESNETTRTGIIETRDRQPSLGRGGQASVTRERDSGNTGARESGNTRDGESGNTRDRESGNTRDRESGNTRERESGNTRDRESGNTRDRASNNTRDRETGNTRNRESGNFRGRESGNSRDRESGHTRGGESGNTRGRESGITRGGVSRASASNNRPLINACRYLARRRTVHHPPLSPNEREEMAERLMTFLREHTSGRSTLNETSRPDSRPNSTGDPVIHSQLPRYQRMLHDLLSNSTSRPDSQPNSTDVPINVDRTGRQYRMANQLLSNSTSRPDSQPNSTDGPINVDRTALQYRMANQLLSNSTSRPDSQPTSTDPPINADQANHRHRLLNQLISNETSRPDSQPSSTDVPINVDRTPRQHRMLNQLLSNSTARPDSQPNYSDPPINADQAEHRHRLLNQLISNETSRSDSQPNSTDVSINSNQPASRYRLLNQLTSNETSRPDSQPNSNRNALSPETRRRRSFLRSLGFPDSDTDRPEGLSQFQSAGARNRRQASRGTRATESAQSSEQGGTEESNRGTSTIRTYDNIFNWRQARADMEAARRNGTDSMSNPEVRQWWENAVRNMSSDDPSVNPRYMLRRNSTLESPLLPQLAPSISTIRIGSSRTNNTSEASEPQRSWRIPSVQVNDVPIELAPSQESSESDNSPNPASQNNNNNSTYPRVMARLAAIRSVSVYNPIGVLRPRLLHPLYATLNPFDADLEQREHIYDSDVISTVTPNHRIQVWDISESKIPDISDPVKNLVVRECKIHNDASVDMDSEGSILVTLLPSGGYLNITNRLGIYSLRWETLGQCLYTTSFVHNAVSVSLSPLGRHLVVGLASRRVSLLPNDRWMMASIFKIEEKDTPGDHLPFIRQIDRGSDDRATSHKSVNCIRWLPTSGQGLIYATNTGQLNIWT